MTDLEQQLTRSLEALGEEAPHHGDLAAVVRRRARRRRATGLGLGAAAAVAAVVVGVTLAALPAGPVRGGSADPLPAGPSVSAAPPQPTGPAATCPAPRTGVLPEWARAGFSEKEPAGIPFVLSSDGEIAAILFNSLASPRPRNEGNKILWVSRATDLGGQPFRAVARLDGTGPPVPIDVPEGLGPSGVDVPGPGCWRFELTWGDRTRTVELRYAPGPADGVDEPPAAVQQAVLSATAGTGNRPDGAVQWTVTTATRARSLLAPAVPVSGDPGAAVYLAQLRGSFVDPGGGPARQVLLVQVGAATTAGEAYGSAVRLTLSTPLDLGRVGTVHRYFLP